MNPDDFEIVVKIYVALVPVRAPSVDEALRMVAVNRRLAEVTRQAECELREKFREFIFGDGDEG